MLKDMKKEICYKLCHPPTFNKNKCYFSCGINKCCLECLLTGENVHSPLSCVLIEKEEGLLFKYAVLKAKYNKEETK